MDAELKHALIGLIMALTRLVGIIGHEIEESE